jgi:hypothetical protein
MKLAIILGAILIIMPGLSTLQAEIYHWIDEDGVRHYGNQPPPENRNIKVLFEEYHYDETADKNRTQSDQEILKALVEDIEAQDRKAEAEEKKKLAEEEANKPMTQEELIAEETERLLKKIAALEAKPLDFFGSQRNKILTIGYYKYRLEDLAKDPDKYFKEPARFEGNVKYSEYY